MGEYADREAEDPVAKKTEQQPAIGPGRKGLNLQRGYLFPSNWEVSVRYTNIKLDENYW